MTPGALAGDKLTVRVQRWVGHWAAARTVLCTIHSSGTYSWWYKPVHRGTYRVRLDHQDGHPPGRRDELAPLQGAVGHAPRP